MKKTTKLICVILSVIILFTGCGMSGLGTSQVTLTKENATDYLTFSLHGGGGDPQYSSTFGVVYNTMEAYGSIEGISGYSYNNVTIVLNFKFRLTSASGKDNGIQTISSGPVVLNLAGNGTVQASGDSYKAGTMNYSLFESKVECLGYEIVSITGTVSPSSN